MRISDKFNIDAFNDVCMNAPIVDVASSVAIRDNGIMLARHLTAVNPKILERKYPKLVFNNLDFHIDNSGGYAQNLQTLRVQSQGGYADKGDARGKVSINMEDNLLNVRLRETLIEWDVDEIKEAELGNYNIVDRKFGAVVKAYNQELDTIAVTGLDANKLGLVNNVHYTTNTGETFLTKSAKEQYDFISDAISTQHSTVNNTDAYKADVCLLPTKIYNRIRRRILNEFTNGSILRVLEANFPDVKFLHTPKLSDYTAPSNQHKMVIFSTDEEAVAFRIPVPMEFSPIYQKHFKFSTASKYRIGGVDVLEPSSGEIVGLGNG